MPLLPKGTKNSGGSYRKLSAVELGFEAGQRGVEAAADPKIAIQSGFARERIVDF
jgi:hypothetical protein